MSVLCRALASHERSWYESRGRGFEHSYSLNDELVWGTAATKHAVSWLHVDDDGFATVCSVKAGSKYWVVAHPRDRDNRSHVRFGENWDPFFPKEDYEMEGLVLEPGTVL